MTGRRGVTLPQISSRRADSKILFRDPLEGLGLGVTVGCRKERVTLGGETSLGPQRILRIMDCRNDRRYAVSSALR